MCETELMQIRYLRLPPNIWGKKSCRVSREFAGHTNTLAWKSRFTFQSWTCESLRQVRVDPGRAAAFSHVVDFLVLDSRLPFGWRSSPGWWSMTASAVAFSQNNASKTTANSLSRGRVIEMGDTYWDLGTGSIIVLGVFSARHAHIPASLVL